MIPGQLFWRGGQVENSYRLNHNHYVPLLWYSSILRTEACCADKGQPRRNRRRCNEWRIAVEDVFCQRQRQEGGGGLSWHLSVRCRGDDYVLSIEWALSNNKSFLALESTQSYL